ncbi:MAG: electron transporter RnfE [Candidatus Zambryskibacteria bacterium RIFOXYC1_FULL_39_10]|uniref:Electron transporter RnfE n=1 Tax=Candidatus Zambryskibacteria bacterium RIFOXYC1_FULL_39_10 TaxID=1802779 RepID=A0A1G2V448_9BACT|nr:MAG: electron transporter RnfE [Candidatus Zambryskibacteria bacterium RIFOXYD1_FULL_39_35]OHB16408.1 MAG: electron transporter RnfE [Candidatus Zambryskibacteria bacterium RIFOXYC1_FULL_39_10]
MYGFYNDYGGWFGGGIMMVVFWVLLVVFIVWIVREVGGKNSSPRSNSSALEILKERYAKGEIDKEEFESKKKDLS